MTGTAAAVEPLTLVSVLAESAAAIKAALEAAPGGGQKRRAHRAERLEAYCEFQRAAHEASVWPTWLGVLEQMARSKEVDGGQILPDLGAARDATAKLLAALSQIRLAGTSGTVWQTWSLLSATRRMPPAVRRCTY